MDKGEIQIEIPDVKKLMGQPDDIFVQLAYRVFNQYEVTHNRGAFNISAYKDDGTLRQIIVTPLEDKKILLYTEDEQSLIAGALRVKSEFEKTNKVSPAHREKFLLELAKDALRSFKGLPHDSEDYKLLSKQVLDHVTSQMPSMASLATNFYSDVTYKINPPKPPGA